MRNYRGRLFCFSPPVMLATFLLELGLAVYAMWRYRLDPVGRIAVAILLCLAAFQLAEFNVCEGAPGDAFTWSRVGYVAITLLPPLGVHLVYRLAGVKRGWLLWPAYISAAAFAGFFLFIGQALQSHACLGNYVIFMILPGSDVLYTAYYYGWLLAAIALMWHYVRAKRGSPRAFIALAAGYSIFLVPTTLVTVMNPNTIGGIPSIMCGFAVLLALMLVLFVLPASVRHAK